ncbi:MAG: hypothetical protein ABI885_03270 [Gammaproteobacteria bacterium]
MDRYRSGALVALLSLSAASLAIAQAPPPSDSTAPSSASSPAQRDATKSSAEEAPTTSSPDPSAASTPHQQHVTEGSTSGGQGKAAHERMMKDCVKEQTKNDAMSKDDAKKACSDKMKMSAAPKKY